MSIRRASHRVRRNRIEKSIELPVSISERLYLQLRELSEHEGVSISEVARTLILRGLADG